MCSGFPRRTTLIIINNYELAFADAEDLVTLGNENLTENS